MRWISGVKHLLCTWMGVSLVPQDPHKVGYSSICMWIQHCYDEMRGRGRRNGCDLRAKESGICIAEQQTLSQSGRQGPIFSIVFYSHYKHTGRLKYPSFNFLANRFDILCKQSHHCRHYGQTHDLDKITKKVDVRAVTGTSSLNS